MPAARLSGSEIAVKSGLGRLGVPVDSERFMADQMPPTGFRALAVELARALHVRALPNHRRGPLDRLPAAQSRVEATTRQKTTGTE